jgi:hypothetical protein
VAFVTAAWRIWPPASCRHPIDVLATDESARQWAQGARETLLDPEHLWDNRRLALSEDERKALLAMALLTDT